MCIFGSGEAKECTDGILIFLGFFFFFFFLLSSG